MPYMAKGKGRSAGEGHVRWRKDGTCEARLYVPVKLRHLYRGQRELAFYGKTEAIAKEKRAAAKRDMEEGRGHSRDLALGPYLSRWLETLASLNIVSERTLQDYRYYAEKHLIPSDKLGDVPLPELTAEDFDLLYGRLAKDEVGPRTINHHVHSTACVALQRAVKKRLIPYNPVRDADPPRYSTDDREYTLLSGDDVQRFFEAASGDRYEALFVTAVLAGPRPAELRALKWEDLTLPDEPDAEGAAHVWRSTVELKGQPPKVFNRTKTGKRRYVILLPEVVVALKVHRARQNEERLALGGIWQDQGLVFPSTTGTVLSRANLTNRHYKPILERAGLPKEIRLYDLRHSFSTLWVDSGQVLKLLQLILGHARYETTANRYVHPTDRARSDAMRRFGGSLRKPS
jgi:integrase